MDPIQQLITQLSQQFAPGVGSLTRAVDPVNGNALPYADTRFNDKPLRLMYRPAGTPGLASPENSGPAPVAGMAPTGPAEGYYAGLTDVFADPGTGKRGSIVGNFGVDGSFLGAEWKEDTTSWVDKALGVAPYLVLGAAGLGALAGSAGAGGAAAGAGAAGGAAGGTGLTAGAGGVTGITAGAGGVTGLTAPAGFALAPEIGAGLVGGAAASAAQPGAGAAAAPAAAAEPASAGAGLFDTLKAGASAIGPTASLLGSAATLGAVNDLQASQPALRGPLSPPVPAAQANPEARGYQAASNPILGVLGRNRQANRNRTMLTGPRGVNMDSVRVGANSLLGL